MMKNENAQRDGKTLILSGEKRTFQFCLPGPTNEIFVTIYRPFRFMKSIGRTVTNSSGTFKVPVLVVFFGNFFAARMAPPHLTSAPILFLL